MPNIFKLGRQLQKGEMDLTDERLQEIYAIQPLQEQVLLYRLNKKFLREAIKETCKAEAKKLQNVEIFIAETELKLPKPERLPKCPKIEEPNFSVDTMIKNYELTSQALEFLK